MWDEVGIYARLDSALYRALVASLAVTGQGFGAQLAVARLFDAPTVAYPACLLPLTFAADMQAVRALEPWSGSDDAAPAWAAQRQFRDGSARMTDWEIEGDRQFAARFAAVAQHQRVVDAACLSFAVEDRAWCALVLIRCGNAEPFTDMDLLKLERFKPAVARLVRRGLQRELNLARAQQADSDRRRASTSELLALLSKTERQILHYLNTSATERQIATAIHRSPHTIHVHVKNIYRKLGVRSRKQLAALFSPANGG